MGNRLSSLSNLNFNCLGGGGAAARPAASQQQQNPPQAQSNAHQSIAHSHSASTLVADLNASTPQDQATTSSSVGIIRPLSSGTQATNHQGLAPPPAAASSSANTTPVDTSESGSDVPLTKGQFMRRRKWSFGLGCGAHGPQSDMMVSEPVPATTVAALSNTQHQQQHPTPPPALQPTAAPAFPQSDDNPSPPAVSGQSDNASSGGKPKRRHHHHHEQSATSLATDAASELSNPDTLAAAASTSPPSSSTMGGGGGPGSPPDAFRARGLIGLPPVKPPMSSHPFGVR